MLIIAGGFGLVPSHAAPTAPVSTATTPRKFNIGYLNEGSDLKNAPALMSRLRQFLLERRDFKAALARNHYQDDDLLPSPCDNTADMAQRMGEDEFDLVFAPAVVYARRIGPDYEPILQTQQPGDLQSPRGEAGVHRRGVIFIGPHSPLFASKLTPIEKARRTLAAAPLAVPTADSAAGFISPRLMMIRDLGLQKTPGFLFCGSDTEVVKHVVSGLADIGACREGTLALLPPPPKGKQYYQILLQTLPIATDPILVHAELMPARSDLGLELKVALREFFNKNKAAGSDLWVENASKRDYETLADYLREVEEKRPRTADSTTVAAPPAQPTPKPVAAPVPQPTPESALAPVLPPDPPGADQPAGRNAR